MPEKHGAIAIKINEVDGDCIDSDNTVEGAVPAVGPNGEIYVAWAGPAGLMFDRSLDQGEKWLTQDIFVDSFPTGWIMAFLESAVQMVCPLPFAI